MPEFREVLQRHPRQYSLICHLFNPRVPTGGVAKAEADALIRNAHTVFFNSRWSRQGGESAIGRPIPQGKYYHYPHRYTFEHPLAWPESARPRLALVGRLDTEHKGIDLGLAALGRLRQEGFDFLFTLYGMGPDESFLRETVKKLGLEDKVSFAGYAEDVRKVWQENEILLLPSRREGCAVAMTEAMGFGRPVIATAVGGAPDWIEPGKEGFLCAAPEAELLAETLRSALQERPRWPEMGRRAHEKVKACLDPNPARVFLESLR
jgi:glycosyltransferase involved in cell wall biosynthesis